VGAWAVPAEDQRGARCPALCLESVRDFRPSALADAEELADAVKVLSRLLRGERQSVASQPEMDGPRGVLPAEVARQWAGQESRPVADFVLAPPVEELPELAPMAQAQQQASRVWPRRQLEWFLVQRA
jgi:hypothetical protein